MEVEQCLSVDVADLTSFHVVKRHSACLEALDVVELGRRVDRRPLVPVPAIRQEAFVVHLVGSRSPERYSPNEGRSSQ